MPASTAAARRTRWFRFNALLGQRRSHLNWPSRRLTAGITGIAEASLRVARPRHARHDHRQIGPPLVISRNDDEDVHQETRHSGDQLHPNLQDTDFAFARFR